MDYRRWVLAGLTSLFLACGGGGGGGSSNPVNSGPTQDSGGIWSGTVYGTAHGDVSCVAASSNSGAMKLFGQDGSLADVQVSVSGSSFTGSGTLYNADETTQTFNVTGGTITANSGFSGQWLSQGASGRLTFTYSAIYDQAVSTASLAGTYHANGSSTTSGSPADATVNSDGTFSGTGGGGPFTGTLSLINTGKNMFNVTVKYSGDPTTYTGLGFWSETASGSFQASTLYVELSGGGSAFGAALLKTASNPVNPDPTQVPSGIWSGTLYGTAHGDEPCVVASSNSGVIKLFGQFGSMADAQVSVSGSSSTGSGTLYNPGGSSQTFSFTGGAITAGSSFSGQWLSQGYSGSLTFTYSSIYEQAVSAASLAGIYNASGSRTTSGTPVALTVNSDGTLSGTGGGGSFTGTLALISTDKNMFNVTVNYSGNPTPFTGLGFWSETASGSFEASTLYVLLSGGGSAFGAALAKMDSGSFGSVNIINNHGDSITGVYITPVTDLSWGPNLVTTPIPNGSSQLFTGFVPGMYDCKLVSSGGYSISSMGIAITAGSTSTLTWATSITSATAGAFRECANTNAKQ